MTAVLLVPRANAQRARMELDSLSLVDRTLKIGEEGEWVLIPLTGTPPPDIAEKHGGRIEEKSLPAREVQKAPMEKIRERIAQLYSGMESKNEPSTPLSLEELPDKWEKLGDVICLRLPPGVDEKMVAHAYADVLGGAAVVDYGGIHGEYREPTARLVLGDSAITIHVENGIRYKLDALKIMFSSGNIDERIRMSTIPMEGEMVVDMFAGIGYFTLPIAIHSGALRVEAYEKNPVSWGYLRENILLNGVEDVVSPHNLDNRECPEKIADRILMGYVGNTHEFLPKAMRILKDDGGWIHYHEACPNSLMKTRPLERLCCAASNSGYSIARWDMRVIKSYAPGVSHIVVDAHLMPNEK